MSCAPRVTGRSAYIVRRHQQFLLACLRLLHTHLSLGISGGLDAACVGAQAGALRTLLFR